MGRLLVSRHVLVAGVAAMVVLTANAGVVAARVHPGNEISKTKSVAVAGGKRGGATLKCPIGDRMLTGGAYWHRAHQNGDPTLDVVLDSSAPTPDAHGWYAAGFNGSGKALDLTLTVQCLPSSSFASSSIVTRTITVDRGRSGNADLICPSAQQMVVGGGAWQLPGKSPSASLNAHLTTDAPDKFGWEGWSVAGLNEGTVVLELRVTAVCLASTALGSTYHVAEVGHQISEGATDEHYASCGSGGRILGGGAEWQYDSSPIRLASDTSATLRSSSATGDGTSWYAGVAQTDGHESTLFIDYTWICLTA